MAFLLPNSSRFDRAAILNAAHLSATFYRRSAGSYAKAFREALRAAWAEAMRERTMFALRGATKPERPEVVALNRQIVRIEMRDRLSSADFDQLATLREEAARLATA